MSICRHWYSQPRTRPATDFASALRVGRRVFCALLPAHAPIARCVPERDDDLLPAEFRPDHACRCHRFAEKGVATFSLGAAKDTAIAPARSASVLRGYAPVGQRCRGSIGCDPELCARAKSPNYVLAPVKARRRK